MNNLRSFTCPMHPEIISDNPGNCPKCGMALVLKAKKNEEAHKQHHAHHEHHHDDHSGHSKTPHDKAHLQHHHDPQTDHDTHTGHDKHAGHHTGDFLKRFWICLAVTIPILLLSHMIQQWLGFKINFKGDHYALAAAGSFIYFYGGMPFLRGMVREIRHNAIGMMTLVAIAITVSYAYSIAVIFGLEGMDFFWELATLIDIMLLGHWLEMRSEMAASRALHTLAALLPATAHVEKHGHIMDIPLSELQMDDIALIKPGEAVPADGIVTDGNSYVNESLLTGESVPVKKEEGAKVIAGSVNETGVLKIKATGTGKDSYLQKVINLVESAQAAKSNTQNLADRVAKWLTYVSLLAGTLTFIFWMTNGHSTSFSLERLVTVMVTACPHALGVAIPLVVAISTSRAAVNGLLIRNRTAFEQSRKITTLIFDKTGTLTKGSHEVQRIIPVAEGYNTNDIIQYAAAVQQSSEHFLGRGVLRKLKELKLELWPSEGFSYMQGVGVTATVKGKQVVAAGPNYFVQHHLALPSVPQEINQDVETINYLIMDGVVTGIITFSDTLRDSSQDAIASLKAMHIKSILVTGDNESIASTVSKKLKMDAYYANILPHQKLEIVKSFQDQGEVVAMTGDGVNDAPALAQADIGIAIGSGTDVAAQTADIILINSDPKDVVNLISFGRATYRKMIQNLFWAVGYNVIALPLAAGVLYPTFVLSPALGAVLMSLSTIIVAMNAQMLRRQL